MSHSLIDAAAEKKLQIGKAGENLATRVDFSGFYIECKNAYGEGHMALTVEPAEDAGGYPVALTDGVYWDVTSADLAVNGTGHAELTYIVGDVVKKSLRWTTVVLSSLIASETPPERWEDYVTSVHKSAAEAREAAAYIANMTVSAEEGEEPAVEKVAGDVLDLHFTLPRGPRGLDGEPGRDGDPGPKGDPGEPGKDYIITEADKTDIAAQVASIAVQPTEPTGSAVAWIDTDTEAEPVNLLTDSDIDLTLTASDKVANAKAVGDKIRDIKTDLEELDGKAVKTVNNVAPDENGNVNVQGGAVNDVQVNGTSVLVDGVANIPYAGNNNDTWGVIRCNGYWGVSLTGGRPTISRASDGEIAGRANIYKPIVPNNLNTALVAGLTDANHITLTAEQQATAQEVLGIYSVEGVTFG